MHKARAATPALIAALWLSVAARATVVPRLDLRELSRSAELIVYGQVTRHWSAWDASHRFIWTHYSFQLHDRFKGANPGTTVISEPGGIVDGMGMRVVGVPQYRDGEEVVVFLHRTPIGYWRCYGLTQGKFSVTQGRVGRKRVRSDLEGTSLKVASRMRTSGPALESVNGITLEEFKQLILREVRIP